MIQRVGAAFLGLPDARGQSNNRRYEMSNAALSAFAIFFTQSPSFLDSQVRMQKQQGKNNAASLFGVHQIPSDNQIRNLLDPVPPETLFPLMAAISDELYRDGYLEPFRSINRTFLIALDGTDFFSSEKLSCPCCTQTTLKNGKTLNRHIAVTPVLVAPDQKAVVALPPHFVQPQDGHDKQDCELAASARWLGQWGAHYAAWGVTYLGDDLYCHQPHCERVLQQHAHFLFTCKPESHATLYEWVADLSRLGSVTTVVRSRRTGKKVFSDTWRYVNQVPLRNSDDALMVNWCELVTTDADGKVVFRNAWATSLAITADNVVELAAAGRARWKIESVPQAHGKEVQHELTDCVKATRKMRAGPSESAFRSRLQTTLSCCGQEPSVVSVGVKASRLHLEQVRIRESNESEPSMTRRNPETCRLNRGRLYLPGQACRGPDYWASGGLRLGGENLIQASVWNCGNQSFRCQGRSTSGRNHEARVPKRSTGTDRPVVVMKAGNAAGAKGSNQAAAFGAQLETGGSG